MCVQSLPTPVSKSVVPMSARSSRVTRRTSAPCSASVRAHVGPASTRVRSSTRTIGERPIALRQRLRRRIADLDDFEQRQFRDGVHLRQLQPLLFAAHEACATACFDDRVLEFEPVPLRDRFFDIRLHRRRARYLEVDVAQVEKIAVQVHPAAVFQLIEAGDLLGIFGRTLAVDFQIARAAHRRRRRAPFDAHALLPACFQLPQLGGGEPGRRNHRGAWRDDLVTRRKHRIAARDLDRIRGRCRQAGDLHELLQRSRRRALACGCRCIHRFLSFE